MKQIDTAGAQGLQFFGRTTASISHELKNALAIIKENAGLLNDYMAMIEKGAPIAPERMKTVAGRIEDQVARADRIIKSLNRYAHSVDDDDRAVELNDLLELFVSVSARPAAMRQISLHFQPSPVPVMIRTAPFLLLTALGQCLAFVLGIVRPGQQVEIGAAAADGVAVYLQLPIEGVEQDPGAYPGPDQAGLLAVLDAAAHWDPASGRIRIGLPLEP